MTGTSSSDTLLTKEEQCPLCDRGYYCPLTATIVSTLKCPPGYYCPTGTGLLNDTIICAKGTYCPEGSPEEILCDPGTYQDELGQPTCKSCPSGNYCLQGATHPVSCPEGSYCPSNTTSATEFLCPVGTFSNRSSLSSIDECTSCTPGHYCETTGLITPTGLCNAGYFCGGGSAVATPFQSSEVVYQISYAGETCVKLLNTTWNDKCPPGHYCNEGQ